MTKKIDLDDFDLVGDEKDLLTNSKLVFINALPKKYAKTARDTTARWFKKQYKKALNSRNPAKMGALSLVNAFIQNNRTYFALNKAGTAKILKADQNWPDEKERGLDGDYYSAILAHLFDKGIIEYILDAKWKGADEKNPMIVKITSDKVKSMMKIEVTEEMESNWLVLCQKFVNKDKKSSDKNTQKEIQASTSSKSKAESRNKATTAANPQTEQQKQASTPKTYTFEEFMELPADQKRKVKPENRERIHSLDQWDRFDDDLKWNDQYLQLGERMAMLRLDDERMAPIRKRKAEAEAAVRDQKQAQVDAFMAAKLAEYNEKVRRGEIVPPTEDQVREHQQTSIKEVRLNKESFDNELKGLLDVLSDILPGKKLGVTESSQVPQAEEDEDEDEWSRF